jgi:predicted nucleic acid-binding protein
VIFLDSNVPMYLVGAAHPHKADAQRALEAAIAAGQRLVTSAEVLQEILHRYAAIGRRDAIQPCFDALLGVADEVFSVGRADVERAKDLLFGHPALSARDALHVAVMQRNDVSRIMSFDTGFDRFPGLQRVS